MKRTLIVVALVAMLLATAAVPAFAGKGSGEKNGPGNQFQYQHARQPFAVVGSITVLGSDSITLAVQSGNRHVKTYIAAELMVQVTENTKFMRWTEEGSVPITFADLGVGQSINVNGLVEEGAFIATRVTVGIPLNCEGR